MLLYHPEEENDDQQEDQLLRQNNHNQSMVVVKTTTTDTTTIHLSSSSSSSSSTTTTTTTAQTTAFRILLQHPTILYILSMEIAERFAYYGFRALLIVYLTQVLHYKESTAIALYGYNSSLSYMTPLLGAYCADTVLGRYQTIVYFSCIYILGLVLFTMATTFPLSSSSLEEDDGQSQSNSQLLFDQRMVSFIGLFFICVGTGGIKPCVSSFGADQLVSIRSRPHTTTSATTNETLNKHPPQQENNIIETDELVVEIRRVYFNYFYLCINIGAISSIAIIPTIRVMTNSFTYAFGTSLLCMILAIFIFVWKRQEYIMIVQQQPNTPSSSVATSSEKPVTTNAGKDHGDMNTTLRYVYQILLHEVQSSCHSISVRTTTFCCHRNRYGKVAGFNRYRIHSHVSDINPNEPDQLVGNDNNLDVIEKNEDQDHTYDDNNNNSCLSFPLESNTTEYGESRRHCQSQQQMLDAIQLVQLLPILATFPVYSCLYDQQGSVWTIQATHMLLPKYVQPEQMNMINPLLIMILIPLFDQVIYPFLQHKCHLSIAPLRLMSWGMFLTAMAFVCSGLVETAMFYYDTVHVFWQLPQILLLATGEIFLSVTSLEFTYAQSPVRMKAFVTALYLSTTGIGDLFAGVLYSTIFSNMTRGTVMYICSIMMLANLRVFMWVANWYERRKVRHQDSYRHINASESAPEVNVVVELPSYNGAVQLYKPMTVKSANI
jgi:dipeptide/tripeptide permease